MTLVKICGITNLEDALLSAKFGADALGFNFYEKSARYISPENARGIIEQLPAKILTVGVFVNAHLEKILATVETAKLDAVQLHGDETPEFVSLLREKFAGEIIKAFRVAADFKPEDVLRFQSDAVLLDAYSAAEHGGTGETFDWAIAKRVREIFPKTYLAGGLNDDNIARAIFEVKPFAVDACSCLEIERGKKDRTNLINFLTTAKNNQLHSPTKNLKTCYELLTAIKRYPSMFLGTESISRLYVFLYGIEFGQKHLSEEISVFDWKQFKPRGEPHYRFGFQSWISHKFFNKDESPYDWSYIILQQTNNDERRALDVFFALLEEFKLEKEDLSDE